MNFFTPNKHLIPLHSIWCRNLGSQASVAPAANKGIVLDKSSQSTVVHFEIIPAGTHGDFINFEFNSHVVLFGGKKVVVRLLRGHIPFPQVVKLHCSFS